MKQLQLLLLSITMLLMATALYSKPKKLFNIETEYEKGWIEGHCEGWKDVRGQLVACPVAPVAPVAEVNRNTYKGGYNRGFKKGYSDASE